MMVTILKGLHGVQNYLDDLIVYGRTAAKHDRKRQAAQGLLPNDGHIQDIMQAPAPTDTAKLRSFLGLTSWYSRFVQNYPSEVEPMRACLRTVSQQVKDKVNKQEDEKTETYLQRLTRVYGKQ
ncbi:gypsy-16 si [Labeo rohita]|uniref:Gypsy-16 si n=1 Tax=Labeo rohita TaxID=84645 RepID=A0A498LFN8_LABRO|nr:gypsy-16 si [Labeo rohita]